MVIKDKLVLVTGSTSGIGKAIAEGFLRLGARVIIHGREQEKVRRQAERYLALQEFTGEPIALCGDVSKAEELEVMCERINKLGKLDILVNNVGVFKTTNFFEISDFDWDHYWNVNVMSVVRLCRHFLRGMLQQNSGKIINISSEAGIKPLPQMVHYSVTKTAVIGLSRALAELTKGKKVTVNSLVIGPTWSEGVERYFNSLAEAENKDVNELTASYFKTHEPNSLIQRFIDVLEVEQAVLFIAANDAINGTALRLEGGIIRSIT
jgi:NAD(P)-dependent dehydrogenase (short-subunit alcohol dehydrogenase family)